jgi:uncharacterized membrane protein
MGVIIPQFILLYVVLTYKTYFIEKKYKSEFLQIKQNKTMKREFRHMLEVVPEGILIYEPNTNQVVMTNSELKRLVSLYGDSRFKNDSSIIKEECHSRTGD